MRSDDMLAPELPAQKYRKYISVSDEGIKLTISSSLDFSEALQ